ncbi:MAG: hypothetical protein ACRBHB_23020 [Arenicella sp.]
MKPPVFEILTWKALKNTSDEAMLAAMSEFSDKVKELPGFRQQSLYKNADNIWICIYYWHTEQQAHDSNAAVADEPSFQRLMSLIEATSITMEVLTPLQSSRRLQFNDD